MEIAILLFIPSLLSFMLNMFLMPKDKRGILLLDIISFNKHRLTYVLTVNGGQNKISFQTVCFRRTMKKDSLAYTIPTINHSHEGIIRIGHHS
jgi:hypothetical protein